jgi:hypothetical protein
VFGNGWLLVKQSRKHLPDRQTGQHNCSLGNEVNELGWDHPPIEITIFLSLTFRVEILCLLKILWLQIWSHPDFTNEVFAFVG